MVEHFIPKTLEDALSILNDKEVTIIAGGTDLMVQRRKWANTAPKFDSTMNIIHLKELDYIKEESDFVRIGSTTSLATILKSDNTPLLLKKAIREIASPALRNVATIAGNIGNASPAGDTLPILYVLDAKIQLVSKSNQRVLPIDEVILGPRRTVLHKDEMIKEIILPKKIFTETVFKKVGGRKADAISKLSFTGAVSLKDTVIEDFRVAFGAVGPVMVRVKDIEKTLIGKTVDEAHDLVFDILAEYEPFITPIDDQRSNKIYRKEVSLNLLRDFLKSL